MSKIAKSLQAAYGCNIYKEDIPELEEILETGMLNSEKAQAGIKKFIQNCEFEKENCEQWRIAYLDRCINQALVNLELI